MQSDFSGGRKVGRRTIQILLVDDQESDAFLTNRALSQISTAKYQVEYAINLTEAIEKARTQTFDVVLLDLGLPESAGIETLQRFRSSIDQELPTIVLTGLDDEETALSALQEGAQDYLRKQDVNPFSLSRSIRYSAHRHQLKTQLAQVITSLQQKNDRLRQLYATAQQFVDNVSHEFRTPLTVIREFTSIVRDGLDGPVTEKQRDHLDKVILRTDDLALMVDDMLDISKLEAGLLSVWRRACRVEELLDSVEPVLVGRAASKLIKLSFEIPPDLPMIFCDEEKASRVIINLAVNAIKFTPHGGEVRVWARLDEASSEVVLGVTDTGPGISASNLNTIFERFRQVGQNIRASTKGFGLGLNIASELVDLNLGSMSVESEVGKGSTFSFTLPCHDSPQLFVKYLDRVCADEDTERNVALVMASLEDSQPGRDSAPVVDEFLQRSVRSGDMVLSCDEHSWAILAQTSESEVPQLIQRLQQEWRDYVRNCPNSDLPEFVMECRGTWRLPGEKVPLQKAFEAVFAAPQGSSRPKVLVVDDDQELNDCLEMRLQAEGYDVVSAADGVEGLKAVGEHTPDAVVLDVRMPKMDGMQMLEHMRMDNATRDTPVVMLSASIRDQNQALEAGANYFVPKPYLASTVLSAIRSSMNREEAI